MKSIRFAGCFLLCAMVAAHAGVKLAPVFSDNAVLQRGREVPVWGTAAAGETVTVSFGNQKVAATADADGKWSVKLAPMPANAQPQTLEAQGESSAARAANILVGEVWIASGQSNMEMPLWGENPRFRHRNANGTGKEVADATNLPLIRFTRMPHKWGQLPDPSEPVEWHEAVAGEALERASAGAFFFARELNRELGVPIGIVGSYWGGSRIEPWTPPEGFDSVPEVADIARRVNAKLPWKKEYREFSEKVLADYSAWLEKYKAAVAAGGQPPVPPQFPPEQVPYEDHQQPTTKYNKMLCGFAPYAVRGAIWYQGEANLGDGALYQHKMQALLNGWRIIFKNPELKFYFAQLAPFNYRGDPTRLPRLWRAQQAFVDANPDTTGMVVLTDAVHDINDIHPADKEVVGMRLARLALNRDYGRADIKADSPRLKSSRAEGNRLLLDFDFVESWQGVDGGSAPYFEVAGVDGIYYPAEAKIEGRQIVVSSPKVAAPKSVRYQWNQLCQGTLANEAGLPLGSFAVPYTPKPEELMAQLDPDARLVYAYDLKSGTLKGDRTRVNYETDNSDAAPASFSRIGYLMWLEGASGELNYAYVSMDAFTADVKKIGVPCAASGANFQTRVGNLYAASNVGGVAVGDIGEGNIEFWPNSYGMLNAAKVPGANDRLYDFGDQITDATKVGYGSMQVHNYKARQTIIAYNNFAGGADADIGIGNCGGQHPDWTFSRSARQWKRAMLYVLIK